MHAGYFIDAYLPIIDGVTTVADAYASRLVRKCDLTVFTPRIRHLEPGYDKRFQYKVVRCNKVIMRETDDYPQGFPVIDREFKARVKADMPDIVHVHSVFLMGLFGKSLAKKHDIPMVGTIHSDFRPDVIGVLGKTIGEPTVKMLMGTYNACDEVWTVNNAVGRKFQQDYGLRRPYRVMPFATDHCPVPDRMAARHQVNAAYGLKDGDFVITHVGRQDLQKREDFILRSLAVLKSDLDDFKMLFVGNGSRQDYLKKLTLDLGLGDNVIFTGVVSDPDALMNIYTRTDLMLFPSESDTFGLVKVEAACQGTPTLFCKDTMAADGITDGVNGFISENNEEAYAGYILRLYRNRGQIDVAGMGARRDLYRTWDNISEIVFENYERLIENHKFVKL